MSVETTTSDLAAPQSAAPQAAIEGSTADRSISRRHWLAGALTGAAAGVTTAAAWRPVREQFRSPLSGTGPATSPDVQSASISAALPESGAQVTPEEAFRIEARRIHERHRLQTQESVAALKKKYEAPAFGRVSVWGLIERLAQCIDPTDTGLWCGSQWLHMQQALAAMEQEGIEDPDLFVIAMLHDLGKLFLATGEVPENVVCGGRRLEEAEPAAGLDALVYQFGHGELIYSRIKGHVPDHIAWTVRYHNIDLLDAAPFLNPREEAYADRYLVPFRHFDANFKSIYAVPDLDMTKYRILIERYFPKPILF